MVALLCHLKIIYCGFNYAQQNLKLNSRQYADYQGFKLDFFSQINVSNQMNTKSFALSVLTLQ